MSVRRYFRLKRWAQGRYEGTKLEVPSDDLGKICVVNESTGYINTSVFTDEVKSFLGKRMHAVDLRYDSCDFCFFNEEDAVLFRLAFL
jgi:hypothetical protein